MTTYSYIGGYSLVPKYGNHTVIDTSQDVGNGFTETLSGSYGGGLILGDGGFDPVDGMVQTGTPGAGDTIVFGGEPAGTLTPTEGPTIVTPIDGGLYTLEASGYYTTNGQFAGFSDPFAAVTGIGGTVGVADFGSNGAYGLAGLVTTQSANISSVGGQLVVMFAADGSTTYSGIAPSSVTVSGALSTPLLTLTVLTSLNPLPGGTPDPVADAGTLIVQGATLSGDTTRVIAGDPTVNPVGVSAVSTVQLMAAELDAKTELDLVANVSALDTDPDGTPTLLATGSKINAGNVVIGTGDTGYGSATTGTATLSLISASSIVALAGANTTGTLVIGDTGTGILRVMGGSTVADQQAIIGNVAGSTGTATLDGGSWINAGYLSVGNSGVGTLTVQNGATLSNTGAFGNAFVAGLNGSAGSMATVTGKGSSWTTDGYFVVGSGDDGTLAVDQGGQVSTANMLQVGLIDGVVGTVNVTNGATLTTNSGGGAGTISTQLGVEGGAEGDLTIDGMGSTFDSKGAVSIGYDGIGDAEVTGGGLFQVDSPTFRVARNEDSQGNLTVSGAGSTLMGTDTTLYVGYGGTGDTTIEEGGTLDVMATDIGGLDSGDGILSIDGQDTTATLGDIVIGNAGIGDLILTGQAAPTANDLTIGEAEGGDGQLTIVDGSSLAVAGTTIVGEEAGSQGTIDIRDQDSSLNARGDVTVGDGGDGTLSLQDAGGMDVTGMLTEGAQDGATGVDDIAGKNTTLHVHGGWTLGDAGAHETDISDQAQVTVDGQFTLGGQAGGDGMLALTDQDTTLTAGGGVAIGDAGNAEVAIGPGATLDASDSDVTLADQDGSVATVEITGMPAGLSGELDAASLTVGGAGEATLDASDGATVSVSGDMKIGDAEGGTGDVTIAGKDTGLTIGGDLTVGGDGTGTLTVSGDGSNVAVSGDTTIGDTGDGTLAVQGGEFDATGKLTIGDTGNGIAFVQLGGSLAASGALTLGENTGGIGELDVNGGNATVTGDLVDGAMGTGTLSITQSGSVMVSGTLTVADHEIGIAQSLTLDTQGTLVVTGDLVVGGAGIGGAQVLAGSQLVAYGAVTIGDMTGAGGTLEVFGMGSTLTFGTLDVGNDGTGSLTVSAGALAGGPVAGVAVHVGVGRDGTGLIDVTGAGSALKAGALEVGSAAGGRGGLEIDAGAVVTVADVHVFAGGTLDLVGGSLLTDLLTLDAGALVTAAGTIGGDITGGARILLGGALAMTGGVGAGLIVDFDSAAETLSLSQPGRFLAEIDGFAAGDAIDLGAFSDISSVISGDTLLLSSLGMQVAALHFNATPAAMAQIVGGRALVESIACFATGTRIATPSGEIAVERLLVGEKVLTTAHGAREIVWIGRRHLRCSAESWPVRIAAGAFGDELPRRDLLLSPEHAVFAEGTLIPAAALLGSPGIDRQPCDEITYWHVELATHDVLLAEGLPCESYRADGNREDFEGGDVITLHPRFTEPMAPIHRQGVAVERLRARLQAAIRPAMKRSHRAS